MAGFFDASGKQPAAIVILFLPQTDTAGKEERFGNIEIRDYLQGDLTKVFSLGRTNMTVFSGKKRKRSKSSKYLLVLFKTAVGILNVELFCIHY